jgi:hypothetical protein
VYNNDNELGTFHVHLNKEPSRRGKLSTIGLLIEVDCFIKKVNQIFNVKRS